MKKFIAVVLILMQFITIRTGIPAEAVQNRRAWNPQFSMTGEEPQDVITSREYTYRVIDEEKKEIELLAIQTEEDRFEIPGVINGYTVIALGYSNWDYEDVRYNETLRIKGSISENVRELIIPDTVRVIGDNAFDGFDKLEKVVFPKSSLSVSEWAFSGCDKLNNIDIPANTLTSRGSFVECTSLKNVTLRGGSIYNSFSEDIDVLRLYGENKSGFFDIAGSINGITIDKVIVNSNVKTVCFNETGRYSKNVVKRLVVNGKRTKIKYKKVPKSRANDVEVQTLYTIRGAKCIAVAEREGMNHHVKSVGKMGKVTKKKVKNGYRYSWKEVNTSVEKNVYKEKYAKWKISNYNAKTVYRVYGKEKKADDYKLLGKTTKTTYKTTYKYVKVKPVKGWS